MAAPFTVLIMAAGHGTRMRSDTPKVLHRIAGKSLVEWVVDAAREAGADRVVAVVRPEDRVAEGLPEGVECVEQREGEGTGAAVLAARDAVVGAGSRGGANGAVVVLSGDQPLITPGQLEGLLREHEQRGAAATLLTTDQLDPAGYGRVVRGGDGQVEDIFETKRTEGLTEEQLAEREVNLGTYAFDASLLFDALERVKLEDGERYLTRVLPVLRQNGGTIAAHRTEDADAAIGVNDRAGLMAAEQAAQRRLIEEHARSGVTFLHPGTTRVEAEVTIGRDTVIGPGTVLEGRTTIGAGCEIGPHTTVRDATIHDGAKVIHAFVLEAEVGPGARVGPFAYLRPGTTIGEGAKVGTFVEIKNSDIGAGAKVPHLSYIGDADVGEGSNLGASTITANYDGRKKHRTKLGKSVKTGVHTSLVAPLDVGDRAYTGAGSTITNDVPEGALGISREKQKNIDGYADRVEEDSPK
ncbi:MAG: bifunctional UDP-N-acetylglucosamine pyrophosphorylase / glucosamine-phosphate N-acetyltransferase [Thermoleophilaceae bacterium]|jgi:bifunctional UDP-N-acetylglucosamine pyrophosphorylase/glucosamine-1-phosphate N-acetyltransferase|nr:bifunctional UDP-N-acetylglucosamine pyrophosphorylase / glucosamine-phosphate N-acetyltransferase [Thermoleophilaceae bacterium]MEA2407567.1 bifunctional UDP-N-acetylglucosamine pyrophosphorylase / glucosamine-phosphate N-acetyltransferase [Thermoleophilaceae bacterium]